MSEDNRIKPILVRVSLMRPSECRKCRRKLMKDGGPISRTLCYTCIRLKKELKAGVV